jgi:ankyrin repeat protein
MNAIKANDVERLREVLATPGIDVNAFIKNDIYNETPLSIASEEGYTEIVELLLAIPGVDVNKGVEYYNISPLFQASSKGHTEVVKLLLARPDIDVNKARTPENWTPLYMACMEARTEVVKLLVARPDLDVNKSSAYNSPLTLSYSKPEILRLLLARPDLDVNKPTKNGIPLCIAVVYAPIEIVKLLLARPDIDVSKTDAHGISPLYKAAERGKIEVVKLLLADPRIVIDDNTHQAVRAKKFISSIVQLIDPPELEELKMPFNAANSISYAPIHNGNEIANFNDESKYDRYYSTKSYNILKGTNPYTRKPIKTIKYYKASIKRNVPAGTKNEITGENIADGNAMANFFDEADAGRFYKRSTFDTQIGPTAATRFRNNDVDHKFPLDPEMDVKYYKARVVRPDPNAPVVINTNVPGISAAEGGYRSRRRSRRSKA